MSDQDFSDGWEAGYASALDGEITPLLKRVADLEAQLRIASECECELRRQLVATVKELESGARSLSSESREAKSDVYTMSESAAASFMEFENTLKPITEPEPLDGRGIRKCRGHWHVTSGDDDLDVPGDPFPDAASALAALDKLNAANHSQCAVNCPSSASPVSFG